MKLTGYLQVGFIKVCVFYALTATFMIATTYSPVVSHDGGGTDLDKVTAGFTCSYSESDAIGSLPTAFVTYGKNGGLVVNSDPHEVHLALEQQLDNINHNLYIKGFCIKENDNG